MLPLSVRRPVALSALAVALLTTLFVLSTAAPAAAHDTLVGSSPEADAAVETLPDVLTLTFSAALIDGDGATAVQVTDAAGDPVTDGEPEVDGAVVSQRLTPGAAGEYQVLWRVVSSDGHPIDGQFSFTVTTGSASETPAEPADPAPSATPIAPVGTETEAPELGDPDGSPVIWTISIIGILLAGAVAVWLSVRRRDAPSSDSDGPAER